jgi:cytochrome P450
LSTQTAMAEWNPMRPEELADPYVSYARARREEPVFYSPILDAWLVTRYDDLLAVLKDTARFSSSDSIYIGGVPEEAADRLPHGYPWDHPSLINLDPPAHARIRKLANQAFKPTAIAAKEPMVRDVADGLIDAFAAAGEVELMESFAVPFPGQVMCRLLDVPAESAADVIGWTDDFLVMLDPQLPHERRVQASLGSADFYAFCESFVADRSANPRDDVMSALIEARDSEVEGEPALTRPELISIFSQLLIGGVETTRRMIGNMVLRLLQHPDQMEEVREDRSLAPAAVEESLRHSSPTKGLFRRAVEDVEIGGTTIPAGALVVVLWASGSHDETRFDDPEAFDLHRANAKDNLAFSRYAHFCIGAPLARLELRVAMERLLDRLPGLRLAGDGPLQWAPLPLHHGLLRLDVAWDGEAAA